MYGVHLLPTKPMNGDSGLQTASTRPLVMVILPATEWYSAGLDKLKKINEKFSVTKS